MRELSAFLLVFCLLSLIVHLTDMALAFAGAAMALMVTDVALARLVGHSRVSRFHREPLL